MTSKEFWEIAEMWYQRRIKLLEIASNPDTSEIKARRAAKLFNEMQRRLIMIQKHAMQISMPPPSDIARGGFICRSNSSVVLIDHNENWIPVNQYMTGKLETESEMFLQTMKDVLNNN